MITPILFAIALLIVVGVFIARPFLKSQPDHALQLTHLERLLAEKETLLTEIRELDFDYETGKLLESDHQQQRAGLVSTAAAVLQQIDNLEQAPTTRTIKPTQKTVHKKSPAVDDEIEAAVTRLRQISAATQVEKAPESNGVTKFCTRCGRAATADDLFCAACGHKLREPQPT